MNQTDPTIILAPLQGFTDVTFRSVFARHFKGVDKAVAPFISTMGEHRLKQVRLRDVSPELNRAIPVIPQILGNVADDFIFLADRLFDMGYRQVNWNLGCPHSKIAKKQRGSGLLQYPEKIDMLLTRIIPSMKPSLSVKIRLGREDKEEIHALLPVLDRHNLTEIILHPRTGVQMYTGTSDLDAFAEAEGKSRHSFVYNGDIVDRASFNAVRERLPHIQRVMIGRGLLANPFLAEELKGHGRETEEVRHKRLSAFHGDLFSAYGEIFSGPGHLTGRMKGFWSYLGPSFEGHNPLLKKILKATTIETYQDRVRAFFDEALPFRPGHQN